MQISQGTTLDKGTVDMGISELQVSYTWYYLGSRHRLKFPVPLY